ncbi:MAG: sulfite exporter TauE/SafE family protein, partial [Proteobacteria bacterium]|nr:sulfite exporter TauE/SafE family protein [Pseudomonadota bacterium]
MNLSELIQAVQQPEAWIFIGFVFAAVAIGGFVKGITGVGLPLVAVPVMASVLGVEHAVAVMIIPSLVSNLAVILVYRAEATANWEIFFMILMGVLGVATGAWILTQLNKEVLFVLMAAWVGVYLLVRIFDPKAQISDRAGRTLGP